MYEDFEMARIKKAQAIVGDRKIAPDSFCKFIVSRTTLCPHKLLDSFSAYWIETINILDGEMGITLPTNPDEVPAVFFEALAAVRIGRNDARREDTAK